MKITGLKKHKTAALTAMIIFTGILCTARAAAGFAAFCADTCLDSLEGRKWVLSDGFLNEQLADRAKTREQGDIIILPGRFATDAQLDAFEKAVQKLGNAKLEAAASLGSAAFALTWMTEQPDIAQKNLMLFSSPSLARLAGFVPIPASLGYVLEKPENVTSNALNGFYQNTRRVTLSARC